ncbi:hypothetical protein GCM10023336_61630 [Streptomyces similanensis]|uniref:Transposase IS701-like DDE domain-containing protein n=1 Tax=Streptomyces similanensis TaxID=1274988 RepID=A0ABP9LD64_9ACTN
MPGSPAWRHRPREPDRLEYHPRRTDLRGRIRDCVRGLLAPVGRKNGRQPAEFAGHRTPDGFQRLLNGAAWDDDDVRDDLQSYVAQHLGDDSRALAIDDTGFIELRRLRHQHDQRTARPAHAPPRRLSSLADASQGTLAPTWSPEMIEGRFRMPPKPALICDCLQSGGQDLNLRPLDPQ